MTWTVQNDQAAGYYFLNTLIELTTDKIYNKIATPGNWLQTAGTYYQIQKYALDTTIQTLTYNPTPLTDSSQSTTFLLIDTIISKLGLYNTSYTTQVMPGSPSPPPTWLQNTPVLTATPYDIMNYTHSGTINIFPTAPTRPFDGATMYSFPALYPFVMVQMSQYNHGVLDVLIPVRFGWAASADWAGCMGALGIPTTYPPWTFMLVGS